MIYILYLYNNYVNLSFNLYFMESLPKRLRIAVHAANKYFDLVPIFPESDAVQSDMVELVDAGLETKCYLESDGFIAGLNPPDSMEKAVSKNKTYAALQKAHIPYPRTLFLPPPSNHEQLRAAIRSALLFASRVGYPLVIKPDRGSAGIGVRLIRHEPELILLLRDYLSAFGDTLLQQLTEGREYRILILRNKILCAFERLGRGCNDNYELAEINTLSASWSDILIQAARATGLNYCGIDLKGCDVESAKLSEGNILDINGHPAINRLIRLKGLEYAENIYRELFRFILNQ